MTTFDKREEGFEKQFVRDEELKFKAMRDATKFSGLWAAEKLGLSGAQAEAYAKEVVHRRFRGTRRPRRVPQDPKGFRRQGCRPIRPSDSPHHGRADGEGGCADIKASG